jgi:hypothetical protein
LISTGVFFIHKAYNNIMIKLFILI